MRVCVFGLWHLGSVISAGLAASGHTVVGLDFNRENINNLQHGQTSISEPGLDELIRENLQKKTLSFTIDPVVALENAELLWIAFDTPVDEQDNADLGYIEKNFELLSGLIKDQTKIVISSQIPVGFTRHLIKKFRDLYPCKKVFFAYSPENLRLGKSLKTFLEPDRIIIGTEPDEKEVFSPVFSSVSTRLEWMTIESAEMTKHAINAFLATSICFANEIAGICESVGANAKEVERGLKTEERIGPKAYLNPGNAFSGGTLARDVRFLQKLGMNNDLPVYLINSIHESNNFQKTWIKRKCLETLGNLNGKSITILGLTYKPGTNTLRRSLSIELCIWLKDQGAKVTAFDPAIRELPSELRPLIILSEDMGKSIENTECIILATEWPVFQQISEGIISNMKGKIIIDPTGFIETALINVQHKRYFAVGRSNNG
jgi:UDPglucose 6-dehydrogenase